MQGSSSSSSSSTSELDPDAIDLNKTFRGPTIDVTDISGRAGRRRGKLPVPTGPPPDVSAGPHRDWIRRWVGLRGWTAEAKESHVVATLVLKVRAAVLWAPFGCAFLQPQLMVLASPPLPDAQPLRLRA